MATQADMRTIVGWCVTAVGTLVSVIFVLWLIPTISANTDTQQKMLREQVRMNERLEFFIERVINLERDVLDNDARLDGHHDRLKDLENGQR